MQFIKNLFKDNSVVGLSSFKKKNVFVQVTTPKEYKYAFLTNTDNNYILY